MFATPWIFFCLDSPLKHAEFGQNFSFKHPGSNRSLFKITKWFKRPIWFCSWQIFRTWAYLIPVWTSDYLWSNNYVWFPMVSKFFFGWIRQSNTQNLDRVEFTKWFKRPIWFCSSQIFWAWACLIPVWTSDYLWSNNYVWFPMTIFHLDATHMHLPWMLASVQYPRVVVW